MKIDCRKAVQRRGQRFGILTCAARRYAGFLKFQAGATALPIFKVRRQHRAQFMAHLPTSGVYHY